MAEVSPVERIGRYRVLAPLGQGGMARVFLAQREGASALCVLKRLHFHVENNSIALKRFQREAHIATLLDHPAIARITDAGTEDGSFCIAMEYVAGQTLEAILDRSKMKGSVFPSAAAIRIALDVLGALAYAHGLVDAEGRRLEIVHRDLSPRNVMVSYAGEVKLIDFGIARGNVDELKTAPGVLMGTPYYMSPEQAQALPVDQRSDLYTFGAVLYEMIAGERLVSAKGRPQILLHVVHGAIPRLAERRPEIGAAIDPVLRRALAKAPAARFSTAGELAAALDAAVGKEAARRGEVSALVRGLFVEEERATEVLLERVRLAVGDLLAEVAPTRVDLRGVTLAAPPILPSPMSAGEMMAPTRTGIVSEPMAREAGAERAEGAGFRFQGAQPTTSRTWVKALLGMCGFIAIAATGLVLVERSISLPAPKAARDPEAPVPPRPTASRRLLSTPSTTAGPPQPTASRRLLSTPSTTAGPIDVDGEGELPQRKENRPDAVTPRRIASKARAPGPPAEKRGEPPERRHPELFALIRRIKASPQDMELWTTLSDRIHAEAERLPQRSRSRIQVTADDALRALDVDGIERALDDLERSSRAE